jgi:hypothetical protein
MIVKPATTGQEKLMKVNRPITKWCILADNHATGSDHEVTEWEAEVHRQEEVGHETVVGSNIAAMTEEDSKAAERLWMELAKERAHLDTECTADEVEQEAAWCQEAIGSVLDTTAKKIGICETWTRWWNADIRERWKAVSKGKRSRSNSEEPVSAKAALQKSIRQSKRTMWNEYLQNLMGGRGMESSTICKPLGRHDCRHLNRQGRQPSKHITRKGGDAEVRVISSK